MDGELIYYIRFSNILRLLVKALVSVCGFISRVRTLDRANTLFMLVVRRELDLSRVAKRLRLAS